MCSGAKKGAARNNNGKAISGTPPRKTKADFKACATAKVKTNGHHMPPTAGCWAQRRPELPF